MTSEFPFSRSARQGFEQPEIVARMQSDGRLVQNVKNAAQIRAELRRQTNALRLAAAQGLRRTPEREIAEPDIFHEPEALRNFRHEIVGDRFLVAAKTQACRSTAALRRPRAR